MVILTIISHIYILNIKNLVVSETTEQTLNQGGHVRIERLSNYELFRVLINKLWQRYSSGGISHGRSYQATLLEGFMYLFPSVGEVEIEGDIIKDVQRRILLEPRRQQDLQKPLLFSEPETLTDPEFALLLLTEMCRWHKEDAVKEGFDNNEHRWMTIKIRVLCEFSFPEISRERVMSIVYTRDTILKIIDDRRYLIERWTAGTNDYLMHGTNPWDS